MIGAVYPTSPDFLLRASQDEQKTKKALMQTVSQRGKYFYNYSDYCASIILRAICCCGCKDKEFVKSRMKKLIRHESASEKLKKEIYII